jgi:hypothetical protein
MPLCTSAIAHGKAGNAARSRNASKSGSAPTRTGRARASVMQSSNDSVPRMVMTSARRGRSTVTNQGTVRNRLVCDVTSTSVWWNGGWDGSEVDAGDRGGDDSPPAAVDSSSRTATVTAPSFPDPTVAMPGLGAGPTAPATAAGDAPAATNLLSRLLGVAPTPSRFSDSAARAVRIMRRSAISLQPHTSARTSPPLPTPQQHTRHPAADPVDV